MAKVHRTAESAIDHADESVESTTLRRGRTVTMFGVIEPLEAREIDEVLRGQTVGRVGCHLDGRTYVVPVIYVWHRDAAYVLSIEGLKIEMMRVNPRVCFEVDEYSGPGEWRSVIVQGVYEELRGNAAAKALALLAARFSGGRSSRRRGEGGQAVAFRILADEVTGRCVRVGRRRAALARIASPLLRR